MRNNHSSEFNKKPRKFPLAVLPELQNQPDYRRFEQLKSQLSSDLNQHEYTNAVRDIARECGV